MSSTDPRPTVVDLFCGAGGLSAGLERAGWKTVAAVDADADCMATLTATKNAALGIPGVDGQTFLGDARLLGTDIRELSARDLRPENVGLRWRPDLLAGGPPCQPFSSAGRMLALEDPRGQLFLDFVRLASELRPRFILFENVAGLVTARGPNGKPGYVLELIQKSFEEIGYACRFDLLNSADYGAPQRRVRLFMVAAASEVVPAFPSPTHSREGEMSLFGGLKPWRSLGDFLKTQPEPSPENLVRPSPARAIEMASLQPGTGVKSGGIVEANRPGGHWGYRQDSFLADESLPSRTIRAATTPDFIRMLDGSLRRLTCQDCAGLQGFPADWRFEGTITSRFRQIGNAVQGDIARVLGTTLYQAVQVRRKARPVSHPWPPYFHKRLRYTEMEERVNGNHRAAAREPR
jgi:DNA (cytosine-5)-methyltransferase 1